MSMSYKNILNTKGEELENIIDTVLNEVEKKYVKDLSYIKDNKEIIIDKIYVYLLKEDYVDNESVLYSPKQHGFTEKDVYTLEKFITEYAYTKSMKFLEKYSLYHTGFENEYRYILVYKDLNILVRHFQGQGTAIQFRKDLEKFINKNENILTINWEDCLEYINKKEI